MHLEKEKLVRVVNMYFMKIFPIVIKYSYFVCNILVKIFCLQIYQLVGKQRRIFSPLLRWQIIQYW